MALLQSGFFGGSVDGGGSGGPGGGDTFTPHQNIYATGNGTTLVPAGASQLTVEIYSKGGDGGEKAAPTGRGGAGGSGAYSFKTFALDAGDYGKTITWDTDDGAKAFVHGDAGAANVTAAALNMQCTNGADGDATTQGTGGVATNGTTNSNGVAGVSGTGGTAPGPAGGLGGAPFTSGTDPGGGGGGGNQSVDSGVGGNPKIILSWS